MIKNILAILFLFAIGSFKHKITLQWQGYFSYNLVRDIAESLIILLLQRMHCFKKFKYQRIKTIILLTV
jgi:hypothetical protein